MIRAFVFIWGIAFILVALTGCSWTQQTREQERTVERNVVQGDVAGVPVNLTHDRTVDRKRDEDQQGTKDTGLEQMVGAMGQAVGAGGSMLTGGGMGLALGLGGMAFAWWKKKQSDAALAQTVTGLEAAKQSLSPEQIELLHTNLSRTMDASTKARVRTIKTKV